MTALNHLYIHIPFCRSKCLYCDFFSGGAKTADFSRYADALIGELRLRADTLPGEYDTLYIGGGTPSILPPALIRRIAEAAGDLLPWHGDRPAEFTLEANPDDITDARCREWRDAGVNRLSLGIQSFSDPLLKSMRRSHDAATGRRALGILASHFDNFSLDLIFGIPGQTLDIWRRDIEEALSFHPVHISCYSMMYEQGTALTALRDAGRLRPVDEETSLLMYDHLRRRLRDAGYEHYEISNFSLPGRRSLHNSAYWTGEPYLGLGPAAHSYDGHRRRTANPHDIRGYIARYSGQGDSQPFASVEILSDDELREEMIMLSMRTCEGLSLQRYAEKFSAAEASRVLCIARKAAERGEVVVADDYIRLTDKGIMVADDLILRLI